MKATKSPNLSNDNLPQIANEMRNKPIGMLPFFSTFTKDKNINCFSDIKNVARVNTFNMK